MIKAIYTIIFISLVGVSLGFCVSKYYEKQEPDLKPLVLDLKQDTLSLDAIIENCIECKKLDELEKQNKLR
jgi:hypothetical protein